MKTIHLIFFLGFILYSCEKKEEPPDFTGVKNTHRILEIIIVRPQLYDVRVNFVYKGEKIIEVVYHGTLINSSVWVPFNKINYTYDGNRVSAVRSEIRTVDWRISDKVEYILENGKVVEESFYDYISNEWVFQRKFTYSYDGSKLTGYKGFEKDLATNDLISIYKGEYSYLNDTLREYIRYKFYDEYVYLPDDRFVFDYVEGRMKSYTEYVQNLNDEWAELIKCEYRYFASGPYEARIFNWNAESESWVDESYYLRFSYNNFGYLAKRLFWDGLEYTYIYEIGHGNAAQFYYYPEELIYGEPTLKSASEIPGNIFDQMHPHKSFF